MARLVIIKQYDKLLSKLYHNCKEHLAKIDNLRDRNEICDLAAMLFFYGFTILLRRKTIPFFEELTEGAGIPKTGDETNIGQRAHPNE